MTTKTKDSKYIARDMAATPIEVTGTDGNYLYSSDGKKYIDFVMGWCVGNIGWSNKKIIEKICKFKGPHYVTPDMLYKPWADLAEKLVSLTPKKLTKCFRATGGTEAVEIAMQAAMSHTKRTKFISIKDSYHGHSIGAMSIGNDDFRKWYTNLLPNCHKISPPLDKDTARQVVDLLKKGDVAAYISEPIICNLGVEIPTQEYYDIVYKACKKYKTLFIMDEVATGFGRTGKLFAYQHYGLEPDIMCFAKGISGGYGSLGATITTDEVAKSMAFEFSFYSTYGWHPLSVEATLANLDYWQKNKTKLLQNVNTISAVFEKKLQAISFPVKTKISIKGLAIGLKFDKKGYSYTLSDNCLKNGLIVSPFDDYTVVMFPSLNIDDKTAQIGLKILENSV